MYVPPRYRVTDDASIDELIRAHGFATLVTHGAGGLMASHVPVELSRDAEGGRVLHGHLAKANPQWRQLEACPEVMVVFLGPHAFVTPTWYDHPNVPTWNYQAVHAYGPARVTHDEHELSASVRALSERYEPPESPPPRFDFDAMPEKLRTAELKGIVGFTIRVERVDAAFKLSQNRNATDKARIIRELRARGDEASRLIAEAMERS